MSLLDKIGDERIWLDFLEYKKSKNHLNKKELAELEDFISDKGYSEIALNIKKPLYNFSTPTKSLVNKVNSQKKRVVYTFSFNENYVLKLLSWLLYKYDDSHCENCYSFRQNFGVKKAIGKIIRTNNIDNMFGYKLDISDYFNSVDVEILLCVLKEVIKDDLELYGFLKNILTTDKSVLGDKLITEKRGIMAGTPISPFLANVYLREMDMYFYKKDVVYARYSDDIILFAKDEGSRNNYREIMLNMLNKFNLKINSTKEFCINPNEKWEFLGISYFSKSIDVSDIAIKKMKGKIRRKANALFRWKKRKNATDERAMKAMIRAFNDKFFDKYDDKSVNLTWSRWYFPVINVNIGLKIIDDYLQRYIRFISSGKHCKKNYKISYDKLKEMGYKSLVNEYYKHKKQKSIEKCDIEKEILIKPINSV